MNSINSSSLKYLAITDSCYGNETRIHSPPREGETDNLQKAQGKQAKTKKKSVRGKQLLVPTTHKAI